MEEEKQTENPQEEPTPVKEEEKPQDDIKTILDEAKAEFEKRLAETTTTLTAKIKERDSIIAELIAGKSPDEQEETFIEKLNKQREQNRKFI